MSIPTLDSRITAVTVLDRHALVTREAELLAGDGPTEQVRFTGLPLALDDSSVRVRVEPLGDGAAPVASDLRVGLEVPDPDPHLAPPRDEELEEARRAVARIKDQQAQVDSLTMRLHRLKAPSRPRGAPGEPPPPAPSGARLALLDLRQGELERLADQRRQLDRQLQEAEDQLQNLESRWQQASTARQARKHELRKSLVVQLQHINGQTPAARCRLVAEYLIAAASWAPSYVIRFDKECSRAELLMRAMVCQASGEDWDGVELTLSTASPVRWNELPELASLRIGRAQAPPPRTGWREPPVGAHALLADYDRARAAITRAQLAAQQRPEPTAHRKPPQELKKVAETTELLADFSVPEAEVEIAMADEEMLMAGLAEEEPMPPVAAAAAMPAMAKAAAGPPGIRKRSKRKHGDPRRTAAARAPSPATPEEPAELAAPADLLSYGRLRLAGADDSRRGTLQPVKTDEIYLELLASLRVEVSFNVMAVVSAAQRVAAASGRREPPPGHLHARSRDGFDHSYVAESRVSVESDGAFHNIPMLHRDAATKLSYVTVPRESPEAFRFVSFTNPLDAPLPEGPADIYVGDDYLLTSRIHTVAAGATTEIGLGVEQSIKVARNTRFAEKTSGLLGGALSLEHEIEIEVANNLSEAAQVEIRERLPIIREGEEEIKVEVTEVEPAWHTLTQERRPIRGAYRWQLTVPSMAKQQLRVQYSVALPSKYELVGGNRREV
jgi:uncharacterized protein (TIGR02231 family)